MKNNQRVWNILKKLVYMCATFLAIIAILAVAVAIDKVLFNIVMIVVYILGLLGIGFIFGKMAIKILHKGIQYIEQRKNKIK